VHHVITDIGSWDRSDGSAVWEYQVGLTVVLVIIGSQLGVALGIAGIRGAGRRADLSMIGLMGNAVLLLMSLSVILRQVTR